MSSSVKWKCFYCEAEVEEDKHCNCEKSQKQWSYITVDAVRTNQGYACPCGNDSFKSVMHLDSEDSCSYVYECTKCQHHITINKQRSKDWY